MTATILINLDVPDVPRAEAFYCAAFGLRPARRFGRGGVELLGAQAPIYLLEKAATTADTFAPATVRHYDRHWTPAHLDFVVDDIDTAIARAVAAGATREGETRTANWGRIAQFADPFGHGVCLVQFLNRGYDEIATP